MIVGDLDLSRAFSDPAYLDRVRGFIVLAEGFVPLAAAPAPEAPADEAPSPARDMASLAASYTVL